MNVINNYCQKKIAYVRMGDSCIEQDEEALLEI